MQKSAEQGYAEAQWRLGFMYYPKWGLVHEVHDINKAFYWFLKGAENGNVDAAEYVVNMLEECIIMEKV